MSQSGRVIVTSNNATLSLQLSKSGQTYCYNVAASNTTHVVIVEGTIFIPVDSSSRGLSPGVTATIVIFVLLLAIFFCLLVLCLLWRRQNIFHMIRFSSK